MSQPGGAVRRLLLLAVGIVAIAGGLATIYRGLGTGETRFAAQRAAAARFAQLGKEAYRTGQPPRQTTPEVGAALDAAFDTGDLSRPVAYDDLDMLNEWMLGLVRIGSIYVFAGTGVADPMQMAVADTARLASQVEHNTVAYAPEMGRYLDAQLAVLRAALDCVATRMAARSEDFASDQAQSGLAKLRGGAAQTLNGVLTTLPIAGLSEEWRAARMPALTGIAPVAARLLPADDKAALRQTAAQVGAALPDPAVKSGLLAFAAALGS